MKGKWTEIPPGHSVNNQRSKWNKWEEEEGGSKRGREKDRQKMWRNEEREYDTNTPLVSLINHMNYAQWYDLKINKLQLHSFR